MKTKNNIKINKEKNKNEWLTDILVAIVSVSVVAIFSSIFSATGMGYLDTLLKPSIWIPNIVFPIVWTTIYVIFVVDVFLMLQYNKYSSLTIFLLIANGILNMLWCLVVFYFNNLFFGEIIIILNTIMSYFLFSYFYSNKKLLAYLTVIFPIWLSLATFFNSALWILN